MNRLKRALAWILTATAMLSLIVIPTSAAEMPTISLSHESAAVTATTTDKVVVKVNISGLNDGDGWAALTLKIFYDANALEFLNGDDDTWESDVIDAAKAQNKKWAINSAINGTEDQDGNSYVAIAATATQNGIPQRVGGNGALWTLAFTVKKDLESQELPLKLVCVDSTINDDSTAMPKTENGKIIVSGVSPTLNAVTLGENTSVTVDGTTAQTVQAAATSAKGTDITGSVAWSVSPVGNGVTVASNGIVTVSAAAKTGTYQITATPDKTKVLGDAMSVELNVGRTKAQAKTIAISGGAASLEIPTGADVSTTFTATVKDQFGDVITNPGITWNITDSNSQTVDGVSVANGVVAVTRDAKDNIADSREFTVSAKASADVIATEKITIKRAAAMAATVTVTGDSSVTVPTTGTSTVAFGAAVKDQYGSDYSGTVQWSSAPTVEGVSIDQSGKVTVTAEAAENVTTDGTVLTIKAACGSVSDTAVFTVMREPAVVTSIAIDGHASVVIPKAGTNTYPYTAKVYDQYGIAMSDKATLSLTSSDDNVVFDAASGILTVKAGAKAENYTLTAVCDNARKELTVKVMDKADAGVALTGKTTVTYGDAAFAMTANVSDEAVGGNGTWTWGSTDPDILTVNNGMVTIVGVGKVSIIATYESDTSYGTDSVEISVAPKDLSISGLTVTAKTYNGSTDAELDSSKMSLNGVLTGDAVSLDASGVTAVFADANAGTGKTVNLTGTFRLEGEQKGNYTIKTDASGYSVTGTIVPKEIGIQSVTAADRDYNGLTGVEITDVVFTGVVGEDTINCTATGTMADANAGENKNVTVTVTLGKGNYTLESGTATTSVTIHQIPYTGEKAVSGAGKYGTKGTLDLASLLPADYVLDSITVTDAEGIFANTPALTGTTLSFTLNGAEKVGKTAAITVPITKCTNYNAYEITVTITVLDKNVQTLSASAINTTYGDSFIPTVVGAQTDVTYAVKAGSEGLLKYEDAKFTAVGSGTAYITATAAETAEYKGASCDIEVVIGKRELTVTADDKSAYVGDKIPELTYTVSGFAFDDDWTLVPAIAVDAADTSKTGEFAITVSGGEVSDNYIVTYAAGKLTVTRKNAASGGSASSTGNTVTVASPAHGEISADTLRAAAGKTVTFTVNPDAGYQISELSVLDRSGKEVALTSLGHGRYSFVMPAKGVTISASFEKEPVEIDYNYADVLPGAWYYDAVQYVTGRGLMSGTRNGFEPELNTTRAMIWTILARMDGVDPTVASGDWYAIARQWAMAYGVSDGTDPDCPITREQFAAMLYRYALSKGLAVCAGEDTNILSYPDAENVSDWAMPAMQWACGTGIINGIDGALAPAQYTSRAQAAAMLMRFLELFK